MKTLLVWICGSALILSLGGCAASDHLILGVNKYCELTEDEKANKEWAIVTGIYPHRGAIICVKDR